MANSSVRTESRGTKELLEAGVVAGLIGGVLMLIVLMIATAVRGMGAGGSLRIIAQAFYGNGAVVGGGPVVAGLVVHLLISIFFGVIFVLLAGRLTPPRAQLAGVVYGIAICLFAFYFGMPALDPLMHEQVELMPGAIFLGHALFGLGVSLAPILNRLFWQHSQHAHAAA